MCNESELLRFDYDYSFPKRDILDNPLLIYANTAEEAKAICENIGKRFSIYDLFEQSMEITRAAARTCHRREPDVFDIKLQTIFDIIVHETYSDESTAMDYAAAFCCSNINECAAFKKGWQEAIKWRKENQI